MRSRVIRKKATEIFKRKGNNNEFDNETGVGVDGSQINTMAGGFVS